MLTNEEEMDRQAKTRRIHELEATLKDIVAVYEWCCVDPVDRGYSSLDSEIHRAKRLLTFPNGDNQ